MYLKKNKIEDIKSFKLIEDKLLFIKVENKELFINYIYIDKGVDPILYDFFNGLLYKRNNDLVYKKEVFENISFLSKSLNRKDISLIIKSNTKFDENDDFAVISDYSFFNFSKIILLGRLKNIIHSINLNCFVFLGSSKTIHAYTLPSATPLWQFDLDIFGQYKPIYSSENERKPYQVAKFLGVWQNQLLVACDGGLILCLSTESGVVLRKWDTLPNSAEESLKNVFRGFIHQSGNVFQLNKAGNKIIGLYYCHWVEICLETGNISTKHLRDTFDTHSISSFQKKSGYAEDETHLYSTVFLDHEKLNYMPTAICALNKETTQIDWFYRFDLDNSDDYVSVQVPQVSNGKLYQLTQNNVLHIFEKEK